MINAFCLLNLTIWNKVNVQRKQKEQRDEQHIGHSQGRSD
jgi:hypothetical protein